MNQENESPSRTKDIKSKIVKIGGQLKKVGRNCNRITGKEGNAAGDYGGNLEIEL